MKILIRSDASVQLGAGHVMRCLALAEGLRERGGTVAFVCRPGAGDLCDIIDAAGFRVHRLPAETSPTWRDDAARTIDAVHGEAPVAWIVVDQYALDAKWESVVRPHVQRILAIDDLADRSHDCDLLLDQNFHPDPDARYAGLVPATCTRLLGPRFALLRREFSAARPARPRVVAQVRRVFVFVSGADPTNVTERVLRALDGVATREVKVDVAIGLSGRHVGGLTEYCAARPGWTVHVQTPRIAELLAAADLAVGAGGGASWERACIGVPSLVLGVATNQLESAEALARAGTQVYLGRVEELDDASMSRALQVLFANQYLRQALAHAAFALTDGRGVQRVARRLLPDHVELRPATAADCDLLYSWRNHPQTRRYFFDPRPLSLSVHRQWLTDALADPARILMVAMSNGRDVGALRYDIRSSEARVSIYLDPLRQREGLGVELLTAGTHWLSAHRQEVSVVTAEVLPANETSLYAFLAAGFRVSHSCLRLELPAAGSSA